MEQAVSAGGQRQLGRVGGGLGVSDLLRARRVLARMGMTFRRHGTRSPRGFSGDAGVLYIGDGDSPGESEIPLLRAALVCPKANAPEEYGEGIAEYLEALAREALEAASGVEDAEAAYYAAGADRDEEYKGRKGRGARLGQHFGPAYLKRSPVVGLLVCDFEIPEEVLSKLTSKGPDGPGGGAVAVAHRDGIRFTGLHRAGASQTVVLEREARAEAGERAPVDLVRRGREAEYLQMRARLVRPRGARVARTLLALRPTRVEPLEAEPGQNVLEVLADKAGVGHSGLLTARAIVEAGYLKRREATSKRAGAVWMSAKMRVDTCAALADALARAIREGSAYAPETLVCFPVGGAPREEWLAGLRERIGGDRPAGDVQRRSQRQAQPHAPKLAFSGAAATAALLSDSPLEAPEPREPLRMVIGDERPAAEMARVLELEPLDVEEDEELPHEAVLLTAYPEGGALIDARREPDGPLSLASPAQLLVDLYLHPGDCEPEYRQGLESALADLL